MHDPSQHPVGACDTCKALGIGIYADEERLVTFANPWLQQGFTQMWNVILLNAELSMGARLLWGTLASYARQEMFAFPGQKRLTADLGCSVSTLAKFTTELEGAGLIESKRRPNQSKTYRLFDPPPAFAERFLTSRESGFPESTNPDSQNLRPKKKQVEEDAVEEEPTEHLFRLESEPSPPSVDKPQIIWDSWESTFPGKNRGGLTPPRRRALTKALAAVGDDEKVCLDAVRGFALWLRKNPDRPQRADIDRVFNTNLTESKNLTDKILGWAKDAEKRTSVSDAIAHVPRVQQGSVRETMNDLAYKLRTDTDLHEGDDNELEYLAKQWGIVPSLRDGTIGWYVDPEVMDQGRRARFAL